MTPTLIPAIISFLLTVMVLSYLFGDNPLFRFVAHVFVGVSAGYVAVIAFYQVILPYLIFPLWNAPMIEKGLLLIPLILSALMLMKISPRLGWLGGPAVAYLVGVSTAVAIGGAVLGTIFPQTAAAIEPFNILDPNQNNPVESLFNGLVMLIGTIGTLAYFHFGARRQADGSVKRNRLIAVFAWVGQLFVALTFGVLFAGVYAAALTALIERIHSFLTLFGTF
jgi:hypothetical protein